jgi:16S rRNA (uracil1498-N3)-methyltransferase
MSLPFFYIEAQDSYPDVLTLNEETSRHVVQVLRMQEGEQLILTDGKGSLLTAFISTADKKHCTVQVLAATAVPPAERNVILAVSLVKNSSRFEWFLEKATELGVTEIIPLLCERTERQHFRYDRMKGILVSAMLQSRQSRLPLLHEPLKFENLINRQWENSILLIAHCEETAKRSLSAIPADRFSNCIILIGPEGDFTEGEINAALAKGYQPVMLGETRLRTETAAVVAATLLKIR